MDLVNSGAGGWGFRIWRLIRLALSGGMDWSLVTYGMAIFQSPKNIFQWPNSARKSLKFRWKSDFCQISGSEIWKFRARKNAIPYPQPFHTPTIGGFEKGLAGGGWRQTNPHKRASPFSKGGIGKRVQKRGLYLGGVKDFFAPTPFRNFWH